MAKFLVREGPRTPADSLRRMLDEAESRAANLKGAGAEAERLLDLLDAIAAEQAHLKELGGDLRPEETRIDSLHAQVRNKKAQVLRELRAAGGIRHLREKRQPSPQAWWWYLDEELAGERRQNLKRWGIIAGVVALLLAGGAAVFQAFFRADPLVVATTNNLSEAQSLIMEGRYAEAIPFIAANVEMDPENAEWYIRLGVLSELTGNAERAQWSYARGKELASSEGGFFEQRAGFFYEAHQYERVLEDAQEAVRLAPDSALAHLMLGRALAGLTRYNEASKAYEKALELAETTDPHLSVMVKIELGYLLQAMGPAELSPTASPSSTE